MNINIQYQHRSIMNPTNEDLSDMGALGFEIKGIVSYLGLTTVFFSRPRPCTVCQGTQLSKDPDYILCQHCKPTNGAEPLELPIKPTARQGLRDRNPQPFGAVGPADDKTPSSPRPAWEDKDLPATSPYGDLPSPANCDHVNRVPFGDRGEKCVNCGYIWGDF